MSTQTGGTERLSDAAGRRIALIAGGAALLIAIIVLATSPLSKLLGPSQFAVAHALHALMAFIFVIVSSMGLYLAILLFGGRLKSLPHLQTVSSLVAVLSAATIIFGNWLYVGYRADTPDSPKTFFLETAPEVHHVFFEFKEHAALYTLPLAAAAAFIIWRYRGAVLENTWLRYCVSSMLILNFIFFAIAFGLGAAITKLRGV